MALKKASRLPDNPPPPPPPEPEEEEEPSEEESSESGEEEEEGDESEEESEVEEKEEPKSKTPQVQPSPVNKKPTLQKQTTPPPPGPQSEVEGSESEEERESEEGEEEDEEEETDFPPSPNVSDFTVKPISPTKPASKDSKPTLKRPSDGPKEDEKDSRNRKKAKTNEGEEKKEKLSTVSASGGVGRVWSEDDEIAVLQGMIDYQKKKGTDPSNDMTAFHEFIKGKLHADISKTQLYEKVRRFKKKFFTNVEKAENGEGPVFSKPHESKAFDLSKKIWGGGAHGNGGVDNVNPKNNGRVKKGGKLGSISGIVKEDEKKDVAKVGSITGIAKVGEKVDVAKDDLSDDAVDFKSKYPHLSQSFDYEGSSFLPDGVRSSLKDNLSLIGSVKAGELEEKWKKLREQEADIFLKRMILLTEQTKLVLDAGKKR